MRPVLPAPVAALLAALAAAAAACVGGGTDAPARFEITVAAEGLTNPVGLALLPTGGLLVAEEGTGANDDSAGISLVSGGRVDPVVTGLPSGRDSGDLSGVPMVGVSPDGQVVYTSHFGAEALLTFPTPSKEAIDAGVVLGPTDLRETMTPLNRVRLTNAFDIAFTPDGVPMVTDASGNGMATATSDGRTEFVHRFDLLGDPNRESLQIDPVPTGIARLGDEYLVTLTGGCPYPDGAGRLVAVDTERNERVVASGLTMPIDVDVGPDGTVWVLEFARFDPGASCFTGQGYRPGSGRLSRLDGERLVPVAEQLDFPGAVLAAPDGSLYVSEVFAGRILHLVPETGVDDLVVGADRPARRWRLSDATDEAGIDFRHGAFATAVSEDPVAMMGGGVCWLDADGDDDLDLYLVNSHAAAETDHWAEAGGVPTNRLYRNDGGRFTAWPDGSGTELAMRGNGCVASDLDGDGDTDLYVTAEGPNALLVNDGTGQFVESAAAAGVDVGGWSTAAAAGDVDGDGQVDLFVGTYIDFDRQIENPSGAFPQDYLGEPNHLFVGNGDGTFTDVTGKVGIGDDLRTLGALFSDLDDDGDLDLYLTNDGQANTLYENRSAGDGVRLVDVTRSASVGDSGSGMGVAGGDFDADGAIDLMVTNWEAELHAVYRGDPDRDLSFAYSTHRLGFSGLGNGTTGWGTAWADLDNDTDLDLLIANGRVPITDLAADAEPIQLLGNLTAEGRPGQLRDWGSRSGLSAIGPRLSRGAAVADFDDDGDLDVAINQIGGRALLLRNDDPPGRSLTVIADPPLPGTRVDVRLDDGTTLRRELHAGSSYLASEDPRLHLGVGDREIESVRVVWPDGVEVVTQTPSAGVVDVVRPGS